MSLKINNLSECDTDYAKGLQAASTLDLLTKHVDEFYPVAWDAFDIVFNFGKAEFKKFRKSLESENKGVYSGDETAAIIMMPEILFKVSIVAEEFKAPWGMTFLRLREVGKITEEKGRFFFHDQAPPSAKPSKERI